MSVSGKNMSIEDKIIDALARKNYKGVLLGVALMLSKSATKDRKDKL